MLFKTLARRVDHKPGTLATSSLVYNVCVQAGVRGAGRARPGRVLDAGEQRQDRSHGQEVGPEIHRSVRSGDVNYRSNYG